MNYSQHITTITGRLVMEFSPIWVWKEEQQLSELADGVEDAIKAIIIEMQDNGTLYEFIDTIGELPAIVTMIGFTATSARGVNQEMAFWTIYEELKIYQPKQQLHVVR